MLSPIGDSARSWFMGNASGASEKRRFLATKSSEKEAKNPLRFLHTVVFPRKNLLARISLM